jgi:hypothetical protein
MNGIKQDVVVLSVSQYNVVDRDTGEANQGTTVRYALSDNLNPCADGNLKGYKLAKSSVGFDDFVKFGDVPGVYSADLLFNVSSDGTTRISASNFVFKRGLSVDKKGA